ncbi:MAG: hypothetical protein COU32_01590 [Candidatus Magasanikbacteria bacterium CG10_big_fil_rev_8_21_14_0_10_42_10]|uniref:DUF5671 domain-containing protein n=2 Tax=Candidatus Magasanikiibacteriota TaxID=1752731 RepID=A0A2H0TWK7_9BACT|nr:MAG: hypothetical protein COU32_01590 [Candidatus Magasanikbacteria bacterium CG10_big_fil_rev_8_21_14_0_10_42_10]PIZ94539.1 MAG: hypothetical protein COX82_00450 [Candidatus Magasanikbacteria bacterium CG_4_10_14_0_2_um_filter_41_10]
MRHAFVRFGVLMNIVILGCFFSLSASPAYAQTLSSDILKQVGSAGDKAGYATSSTSTPAVFFASLITVLLSFVGVLFLVLLVYAGYVRLTSHGDEDRVKKSTKTLVAALLGLTIVLLAYGITRFIVPRVYNATTYDPKYDINNQAPNTTYQKSIDIKLF